MAGSAGWRSAHCACMFTPLVKGTVQAVVTVSSLYTVSDVMEITERG